MPIEGILFYIDNESKGERFNEKKINKGIEGMKENIFYKRGDKL